MKERKIKMITGCKTYGSRSITEDGTCGDPECHNCARINKMFLEEVKEQLKNLGDVNAPGITGNVFKDKEFKPFIQEYTRPTREQIKEAVEYVFRNKDNEL